MEDFIKKYKNQLIIFGFVVMVYFLYFHNIWAYKLLDVDETRYVDMSRVMHHTKDFLTLYLNNEYFFEKPPLYFWLENISFYIFRTINEFSARIPGVLGTIITSAALFFTVKKITKNKAQAVFSTLILMTSIEYIILSKIAILDILLSNMITLSVLCGFMTFFSKENHKKYFWWGFYVFSALAILSKGIPGLVVPFISMFFIGLYTKKLKEYFKPKYFIVGLILFLLIVLPWHVIMFKIHDPLFFKEYIIKHHIERFLGGEVIHRDEPFWFYIVTIVWGLMPYTPSLVTLFVEKLKKIKEFKLTKFDDLSDTSKLLSLASISALVIFLFFTSSSTKLITYILPIYPYFAIILGKYWQEYIVENKHKKYIEIPTIVLNSLYILAGVVFPFVICFLKNPLKSDLKLLSPAASIIAITFPLIGIIAIKKQKRIWVLLSYVLMFSATSAFIFSAAMNLDYRFGQNDLIEYATYAKKNNLDISTFETGKRYSLNYYSEDNINYDVQNPEIAKILKNKKNIMVVRKKDQNKIGIKYKIINIGRKYLLIKGK